MLLLANTIMLGFLALIWSTKKFIDIAIKTSLASLFILNLLSLLVELGYVIKQ